MRGILRGFVALALLASIAVGVGGHVGWDLPFAPFSLDGSSSPWLMAADQDVSAAIQQVIQHANEEQVQAIAAHDPSVMADTATGDHFQEMVQINQDLLN